MSAIKIIRQTVLDHGYVEVVESWGSDEVIIGSCSVAITESRPGNGARVARCSHLEHTIREAEALFPHYVRQARLLRVASLAEALAEALRISEGLGTPESMRTLAALDDEYQAAVAATKGEDA